MLPKEAFNPADFVSHDDADADIEENGEDLGNEMTPEQIAEIEAEQGKPTKPAKKKPAKKAVSEEEEEEEPEEEEEEEPEEEEEEEPEEEEGAPKPTKAERELQKKLTRVSRARENLEAQVRELRAEQEQQLQTRSEASKQRFEKMMSDLDALYEEVEEHRAKGETAQAAKVQRKIDGIRDDMTRAQASMAATREAVQQTEVRAFNTMVKELEFIDPRFDPDHDDFDQEMLDDVNEAVDGFEAKGLPLTEALRKACKLVLREDVFAKGRSLKRDKPAGKVEPRKTNVEKNLKDAKKRPPDPPGTRREKATAEIDFETISEADFDALPESTLSRYLGKDG